MHFLDIETWKRREHFEFFRHFDEPFFGMVAEVDCTVAYKKSKEKKQSFFASYLHKSISAVNQVEELRYRIDGDKICVYDAVHASSTIGRADETFAFTFVPFNPQFAVFNKALQAEIDQVKQTSGLRFTKDAERKDVVHYSSIPWSSFSGLTHARNFNTEDSAPKITFGRLIEKEGKRMMPVAVYVHHALADGFHVGRYLDCFQTLLNS